MQNNLTDLEKSCIEFAANPVIKGITWQDVTTSISSQPTYAPSSFEATIGNCRITVMRNHAYYKDKWCFTCNELNFESKIIGGNDMTAEQAVTEAYLMCRRRVDTMYHAFNKNYL